MDIIKMHDGYNMIFYTVRCMQKRVTHMYNHATKHKKADELVITDNNDTVGQS